MFLYYSYVILLLAVPNRKYIYKFSEKKVKNYLYAEPLQVLQRIQPFFYFNGKYKGNYIKYIIYAPSNNNFSFCFLRYHYNPILST